MKETNIKKKLDKYIKKNTKEHFNILYILLIPFLLIELLTSKINLIKNIGEQEKIDDYIDSELNKSDFKTTLFNLIDTKNFNDSDVYNKVHIDRRLFNKIKNDKTHHPSKETVILLGLALELNENEIEELLNSAGYSLPKNNKYDLIIRFCFINKIYKIKDVNDLLDIYNCKLFNY